jgi:hypothetical protein
MADRFLKFMIARLRFAAANLPVLPLITFFLVIAAGVFQLFLLPRHEAAIEDAESRLVSLERSARRAAIERQSEQVDTPEDTRQRLLDRFPTEDQLNAELGRLIELAGKEGLQVPSGDYRLVPGKDGLFDRYVLNLPVKGAYLTVRRYLAVVRKEFPDLAVDDISLRRENIGSGEVEAQLRFILFGRRAAE